MSRTTDGPVVRTVSRVVDADGGRIDLFGIPVWSVRLEIDAGSLARLIVDIDQQLEIRHLADVPGQQTGSVMQGREEPWWVEYHRALLSATDVLAGALRPGWSERFFRTWGLRFDRIEDYRAERWWVHCHQPATYSCVVMLSQPAALAGDPRGATLLRNPQANVRGLTGATTEWHGPSDELSGLIFPGPVEHQPEVPRPVAGDWATARRLVVTDVCYY